MHRFAQGRGWVPVPPAQMPSELLKTSVMMTYTGHVDITMDATSQTSTLRSGIQWSETTDRCLLEACSNLKLVLCCLLDGMCT